MPQFILAHGDAQNEGAFGALSPFVRGYIECMFFTNQSPLCGEDHANAPDGQNDGEIPGEYSTADLAPETLEQIKTDCEAFELRASGILAAAYQRNYDAEQAGRDFWFSRNGHGVGFFDREELRRTPQLVDALEELADSFGESSVYVGDDEKIYLG